MSLLPLPLILRRVDIDIFTLLRSPHCRHDTPAIFFASYARAAAIADYYDAMMMPCHYEMIAGRQMLPCCSFYGFADADIDTTL